MTSKLIPVAAAVVLVCGIVSRASAADGIQLTQTRTSGTTVQTVQIQLDNTHMRTEIKDASGKSQIVLFDGTNQVLDIIDMEKKTYSEMTKADLDRMAGQMQGMMATMQQQLANMPPAQRAQMEAMMSGRMGGAAAPAKPVYKRNGTDKVGRWTCDKYDGYTDTEKTSEVCTVAPSALGFGTTDLDVTRQLAEFYSKLLPQAADQITSVGRLEEQGFSGFPVRRISAIGPRQTTTEVTQAGRVALAASVFALPPGLTKQESPLAAAGRRGR